MSFRIQLRSGSLAEWSAAEAAGNGKLRKGEIGVGWIESGGVITEVVMRVGPGATPTVFSACPVITRSPLTAVGADVKIPVVDTASKANAIVTLSGGQFIAIDDDPGEYASSTDTDEGSEGGGNPVETPPAITELSLTRGGVAVSSAINLEHDAVVSDMVLSVVVTGDPAPTVTATLGSDATTSTLNGTFASGKWNFPVPLSATASGLHVITVTAQSTIKPNSVQTREFTVERAAAPEAVTIDITSISIRDNATDQAVTVLGNGTATVLRAEVTTSTVATATTYQWKRGLADIAGATAQTYTLQAADDDSNVSCVVGVERTVGADTASDSASASVAVGAVEAGWTGLAPSADSRLIYVSNTGDDSAAASAKGRGYYLPSDPEIGPDPTNPVGPIAAYASPVEAAKRFRGRNWIGTDSAGGIPNYTWQAPGNRAGYPDWILFRRGETFTMPEVPTAWGPKVQSPTALLGNWHQTQFSYQGGGASGRSASEPGVVTAWGPPTDARPIVNPFGPDSNSRDMALVSIETTNAMDWRSMNSVGSSDGNTLDGLLIEDVKAKAFGGANLTKMKGARFRRCVVSGSFNGSGHNQGFYVYGTDEMTFEECVFDRNGFKEDPDDATKWTAGVTSGNQPGALPAGTGVQPTRTYYDRNLYLSKYDSMTVRGNIISRNGGGSSVQMREGGVAERNLFIWNETALGMSHPQTDPARHKGSLIKDNVVLHDDHFLPPGGWGAGIGAGGADDDLAVIDGNIVAHFHQGNNGSQSLGVVGKSYYNASQPASKLMRGIIKDNAIYREFGGVGIMVMDDVHDYGVLDADVTGNAVSTPSQLSMQGNSTKPAEFVYTGNKFHSATVDGLFRWGWEANSNGDWRGAPFTDGTFSQWQSAGFDTDGTFTNDFAAFKAAAGWTAPERDIVSYMQSVDPTYVVNEDVYVDEESSVKQAVRQKVWEVLSDPAKAGNNVMSTDRAKQAARRYHAFITFIGRAKANRKGAWDTRWTAEAVNNYIREGFGKAPVTGPYNKMSLATRLAEYAS